jgi:two-component system phosphate regulon sensor histidine kinase PhoR
MEIIHRQADRLGRLLNDLLDLSNIELERAPLSIRPVSLADVARQAAAMLLPQAERKSIQLVTAVPAELPAVMADRDRLVQILVNLIDNAVKYTPEGGKVTVIAERASGASSPLVSSSQLALPPTDQSVPAPGDFVDIAVMDTGIGIPRKDLPRITERFYRVDKARSRELGGTGLGLAIVKHLVQAHGGSLTIESELGKGTDVRFTLPAATASHPSAVKEP